MWRQGGKGGRIDREDAKKLLDREKTTCRWPASEALETKRDTGRAKEGEARKGKKGTGKRNADESEDLPWDPNWNPENPDARKGAKPPTRTICKHSMQECAWGERMQEWR